MITSIKAFLAAILVVLWLSCQAMAGLGGAGGGGGGGGGGHGGGGGGGGGHHGGGGGKGGPGHRNNKRHAYSGVAGWDFCGGGGDDGSGGGDDGDDGGGDGDDAGGSDRGGGRVYPPGSGPGGTAFLNAPDDSSDVNARPAVVDRSGATGPLNLAGHGAHFGPGHDPGWYHGNWHDHWNHPWYHRPAAWWAEGLATGFTLADLAAPWTWGYWPYDNPYSASPVIVGDTTIDYAQPLAMAAPAVTAAGTQVAQADDARSPADRAMALLDTARVAFTQGNYLQALVQCDQAIASQPKDLVAHEFRGLILFALGRYKEAASPIYAVLSVKPGWDWTTLCSLYADIIPTPSSFAPWSTTSQPIRTPPRPGSCWFTTT